jgi:hypothetical protein
MHAQKRILPFTLIDCTPTEASHAPDVNSSLRREAAENAGGIPLNEILRHVSSVAPCRAVDFAGTLVAQAHEKCLRVLPNLQGSEAQIALAQELS